jgi:glycine cleavage system T protein (aminomethyltransferase)
MERELVFPSDQSVRPGPPKPSSILRPGMRSLAPGEERYRVPGGGAIAVPIHAGDRLRLVDAEGMQSCELVATDVTGAIDPAILGARGDSDASGLKQILSGTSESARSVRAGLERRGIDFARARAVTLFGGESRPGQSAEFTVTRDGLLIVAAPGAAMEAGAQNTATPIRLHVFRSRLRPASETHLPEPLADPLQDIRVNNSTAEAYVVRAGEYIQIIDVAGRQCTDFQCFAARKLDKGEEHPLDVTTTRSMTGQSYPLPGLASKAFDQGMQPLVEVVRDTVGRHDAFGLACSARYYDDQGYPGHVNCTDNFNKQLAPYGIAPRKGWMALNLFYNTGIDAHNVLYFDEPWSRPGDYVLLRAITDLVCVSSSCPDDIDPANGWNPTDIHVRTYSDKQSFSRAVAYRMTPDAEPELTRETAFHPRFSALTRNYTEYRGYWLPTRFSNEGPAAEYWACRERAAIMDLSPLRKFEVTGPDAESLLQYALTRNVRKLAIGQVVYTAMCYEHGGMIDDGTLFRLGDNNFRWIGGDDYGGVWLRELAEKLGLKAWVRSSTDQLHNVAVQGPKSRDILREVVWTPPAQATLDELGWFRFTIGRIGGFEGAPVVVSRTGYTGELGYEVFCHPKDALTVFDAIWQAGEPYGLMPLGLQALDMVRIEAGLAFAGYEFCDQTDPFEAGIGFTVPLAAKNEDFIGREALLRRKEHPQKTLVGLEMEGDETVGHGDCVHIGRAQIGVVTSATRSPILKKTIALARLDVTHAGIGTEVEVGKLDGHQKRLPARIVRFPHYDPEKTRVRA